MRRVLALTGPDTEDFLQDLVTNDVAGLDRGAVYAALLTPQGKLIADFFLIRRDGAVLMDLPEDVADSVAMRLTMYKLRRAVSVEESGLKVSRGTGPAPEGAVADPRHATLGWRLYGDEEGTEGVDFDALRVAACVPEWGSELGPDTFILEAGFDRLHGVDFRKGCYVGQEVTARMHHKTELRKGFVTVEVEGSAPVGTEITRDGKPVGTLHTQAGGRAIAYLRFDRTGAGMTAGEARVSWTG
ncbi:YgfZ/GcvT domain-containing protein [Mesobacterium pallidum]|uniref:CAF17-like 4Fe-4S cluster assembly/insertion protein YgfZ n=1 Tax=Mesobacterium pallidum TaxID=2872037 RepID=UPI001EE2A86E|nr:folate-binding protein [Mesobacterium pallidum]